MTEYTVNMTNLINYKDLSKSKIVQAVAQFYNFPENFHNFILKRDDEHVIEIKFLNYRKDSCSIIFQKHYKDFRLKKGCGGVNIDYLKLINNLIKLKIFILK